MTGAFAQGSRMEALAEDQYYQPDEWEDEDEQDPDEAHDRMMDERDEDQWR